MMIFALLAIQAADMDALQIISRCTDQAAYYIAYSSEPLADTARIAITLCSDEQMRAEALLFERGGDEQAAIRRAAAFATVAGQRAERIAFRVRVCKQDISCNAFMDARGVVGPGPYRR